MAFGLIISENVSGIILSFLFLLTVPLFDEVIVTSLSYCIEVRNKAAMRRHRV